MIAGREKIRVKIIHGMKGKREQEQKRGEAHTLRKCWLLEITRRDTFAIIDASLSVFHAPFCFRESRSLEIRPYMGAGCHHLARYYNTSYTVSYTPLHVIVMRCGMVCMYVWCVEVSFVARIEIHPWGASRRLPRCLESREAPEEGWKLVRGRIDGAVLFVSHDIRPLPVAYCGTSKYI